MRIIVQKQQSEVWDRKPFGATFTFRNREHTPYNKRDGEVDSICELRVFKHPEGAINVRLEETTTAESGRVAGRVIDTDLIGDHAEALANYIKPGPVINKEDLSNFATLAALVKLKYGNLEEDIWDLIQRVDARIAVLGEQL